MFFERGSTGGEKMDGIPYWVWITLPEIFPEYLPDKKAGRGYSSFGMIYEPGDDPRYALPLGMSRRNVSGLDVVYLNCAVCHTGTVRDTPASQPRWVPGMPAHEFNLGAWGTFLTTIPKDQKFTPQRILDQIDAMQDDPHRVVTKPDFIDRLIFRYYAVYLMRDKLLVLGQRLSFIDNRTWGPGRVDTFNAPKALLNFPMDKADPKELMGNVDFPSVWNQGPREGMQLHWDGNNTSVNERNLSAAFGTGAHPPILDTDRVLRMAKFLRTAQPPPYPYTIDKVLAAKGKPIYERILPSMSRDFATAVPLRVRPRMANATSRLRTRNALAPWSRSKRLARIGHALILIHGCSQSTRARSTLDMRKTGDLIRRTLSDSTRSGRLPVTPARRSMESGFARLFCTTARFRICVNSWSRNRHERRSFIAATMSSIPRT